MKQYFAANFLLDTIVGGNEGIARTCQNKSEAKT